jgi:hypothetical protein
LEEVFLRVEKEGTEEFEKDYLSPEKGKEIALERKETHSGITDVDLDDFTIVKHQARGICRNFFVQLWALIVKRFHQNRRSLGTLFIEIGVPLLMIIAALGLTKIEYNFNSAMREYNIDDFPLKQRILYNTNNLVTSDTTTSTMIGNFDSAANYDPLAVTLSST